MAADWLTVKSVVDMKLRLMILWRSCLAGTSQFAFLAKLGWTIVLGELEGEIDFTQRDMAVEYLLMPERAKKLGVSACCFEL